MNTFISGNCAILHFDGQIYHTPFARGHTDEQTADFSLQNSINDSLLTARAQFISLFQEATMPMWAGGSVNMSTLVTIDPFQFPKD